MTAAGSSRVCGSRAQSAESRFQHSRNAEHTLGPTPPHHQHRPQRVPTPPSLLPTRPSGTQRLPTPPPDRGSDTAWQHNAMWATGVCRNSTFRGVGPLCAPWYGCIGRGPMLRTCTISPYVIDRNSRGTHLSRSSRCNRPPGNSMSWGFRRHDLLRCCSPRSARPGTRTSHSSPYARPL